MPSSVNVKYSLSLCLPSLQWCMFTVPAAPTTCGKSGQLGSKSIQLMIHLLITQFKCRLFRCRSKTYCLSTLKTKVFKLLHFFTPRNKIYLCISQKQISLVVLLFNYGCYGVSKNVIKDSAYAGLSVFCR